MLLERDSSLLVKDISPFAQLKEIKGYVHSKGIDTGTIELGLAHPDYVGIMTNAPEAVGYACALAEVQGIPVTDVSDTWRQEDILNTLYFQLFAEGENSQKDYEELLQRTEGMPLYIIVHTESDVFPQRRDQPLKSLFYTFLENLTARGNVRTILYGNHTNKFPENIRNKLLPTLGNEAFLPDQQYYGLSTSSSTSSGVTGFIS